MANKTFSTLSQEECLATYLEVLKNADQKWDAALCQADKKEFALTISLQIISIGELVKSLLLFLDRRGFRLR